MAENMTPDQYVEIIYSYMNIFLKKIVDCYQEKKEADHTAEQKQELKKVPVWVFWWQGEQDAPEMVRLCINSIRRNVEGDAAQVHVISHENYQEFIDLPELVQQRFDEGVIGMTHFADVLRCGLLAVYGGFWIDSTVFVPHPISSAFMESQAFFSQNFGVEVHAPYPDVAKGRWGTYLLKGGRDVRLFSFLYDAWIFYLERHNKILDYYLIDYMIAVAHDLIPDIGRSIDDCPANNLHIGDLMDIYGEQEHDMEWYDVLTHDTQFFKMSYKRELPKTTQDGELTTYGYMYQEFLSEEET